jgi:hypothetical protein
MMVRVAETRLLAAAACPLGLGLLATFLQVARVNEGLIFGVIIFVLLVVGLVARTRVASQPGQTLAAAASASQSPSISAEAATIRAIVVVETPPLVVRTEAEGESRENIVSTDTKPVRTHGAGAH